MSTIQEVDGVQGQRITGLKEDLRGLTKEVFSEPVTFNPRLDRGVETGQRTRQTEFNAEVEHVKNHEAEKNLIYLRNDKEVREIVAQGVNIVMTRAMKPEVVHNSEYFGTGQAKAGIWIFFQSVI